MVLLAAATRAQRGWHFFINALAFSLCYPLANFLAQQGHVSRHLVFDVERATPFLPWMIIPYLSSGLFFVLAFAWVRGADAVRVLSQRLLLATVAATAVFVLYPLQFSAPRPAVASAWLAPLFAYLSVFDRPYNQLPSLHVAFCVIFWCSLRDLPAHFLARCALLAWLALVALATLFTYQHQLIDVAGGLLLGAATVVLLRPGRRQAQVAFYYLMAAAIVLLAGVLVLHYWALLYPVACLLLVSLAYHRGERHFLRKKDGRHPFRIWLLYGPYLAAYSLLWHGVRARGQAPFAQWAPQLWVGRRLTVAEAAQLPENCVVFDLAGELSETPCLRGQRYRHFPLLDLQVLPAALVAQIVAAMAEEMAAGRVLYLHCAMGYSRSIFIAKCYMDKTSR
ncbi:membrane-associated phospholipid phosphatase [Oxalobacteraceae bacterium GrIS 1.11]